MKVLVVDDSIVYRKGIGSLIEEAPNLELVGTAKNGQEAIDFLKENSADVISLDLEMPIKGGLDTIQEIRKTDKKVKIIVFSAFSKEGASKTLQALEYGADDFATKVLDASKIEEGFNKVRDELLPKIAQFKWKRSPGESLEEKSPVVNSETLSDSPKDLKEFVPNVICIGSSTGGPEALKKIFMGIERKIHLPILIVQHMPPFFTAQLADLLDKKCPHLEVKEAQEGDLVLPGRVLIAPGDYHMEVVRNSEGKSIIHLNQDDKVCSVRPAVDVLFNSLSKLYGRGVFSIVLTGMGQDGLEGVKEIKKYGGVCFSQSKETCTVYGMPMAIESNGLSDKVLDLKDFSNYLNGLAS